MDTWWHWTRTRRAHTIDSQTGDRVIMRSRSGAVFKRRSVAAGNNQATHWYQTNTVAHCRFLNMCFVQLICERFPVSRKSILWLFSTVPILCRHEADMSGPNLHPGLAARLVTPLLEVSVFFYTYQDLLRLLATLVSCQGFFNSILTLLVSGHNLHRMWFSKNTIWKTLSFLPKSKQWTI